MKNFAVTRVQRVGDDLIISFNDKSEIVVNISTFKENRVEESDEEKKKRLVLGMYVERGGKSFLIDESSGISVEI